LLPAAAGTNAPNEVMRLIEWLMSNALDVDDLFLAPGQPDLLISIREALDTGADFDFPDGIDPLAVALSMGEALAQLLDSLPVPVIPWAFQSSCGQAENREAAFELLDGLPPVNLNVWISLTAFLHFLCQQKANTSSGDHATDLANQSFRTRAIAAVFTPILLRDPPKGSVSSAPASSTDSSSFTSPLDKRNFLLYFII